MFSSCLDPFGLAVLSFTHRENYSSSVFAEQYIVTSEFTRQNTLFLYDRQSLWRHPLQRQKTRKTNFSVSAAIAHSSLFVDKSFARLYTLSPWHAPLFSSGLRDCFQSLKSLDMIKGDIWKDYEVNNPHLRSVGADRKFVKIHNYFASADRVFTRKLSFAHVCAGSVVTSWLRYTSVLIL